MSARDPRNIDDRLLLGAEAPPPACPVCGADRTADDEVLCRVCGEPVLRGGWAP